MKRVGEVIHTAIETELSLQSPTARSRYRLTGELVAALPGQEVKDMSDIVCRSQFMLAWNTMRLRLYNPMG